MQKLFNLTLILVIVSNYLFSQEIILTFVSASDTISIDSIQAINLTTNERLTVPGGESVNLNDIATSTIEIKILPENSKVYPNPFREYTTLQFAATKNETIKLVMINSGGKTLATFNQNLLPGNHQFKIIAKSPGIYFINIHSGEKIISKKLVSLTKGIQDRIEYSGANGETAIINKSSKLTQSEQVIHFKLYAGENVTIISDSPAESKTYEVEFYECKDADGQHYPIVQIGEQWWMAKNLAYLPSVSPDTLGSITPKHYYVYGYNDNDVNAAKATDNYSTYGVLYNWAAAMDGTDSSNSNPSGVQGVCPAGWHLPSDDEWKQLEMAIGINQSEVDNNGWRGTNEGAKLKGTSYWPTDRNGSDDYGFSGLPGGTRDRNVNFISIGLAAPWWTSTEFLSTDAWGRILNVMSSSVSRSSSNKETGFSVRCVRDPIN